MHYYSTAVSDPLHCDRRNAVKLRFMPLCRTVAAVQTANLKQIGRHTGHGNWIIEELPSNLAPLHQRSFSDAEFYLTFL